MVCLYTRCSNAEKITRLLGIIVQKVQYMAIIPYILSHHLYHAFYSGAVLYHATSLSVICCISTSVCTVNSLCSSTITATQTRNKEICKLLFRVKNCPIKEITLLYLPFRCGRYAITFFYCKKPFKMVLQIIQLQYINVAYILFMLHLLTPIRSEVL